MKNKIKYEISEEDVILNLFGMLDEKTSGLFESGISAFAATDKDLIREYNNLLSLLSVASLTGKFLTPESSVKINLFKKLKSNNTGATDKPKDFNFIFSDSIKWMPHPEFEGLKIKPLSANNEKGYLMILLKAAAGSEYPSHHHTGPEECFVLEGDLIVEGKILGPGDFHHAEGGSDHEPLRTKNGCTLLLVADPKDY